MSYNQLLHKLKYVIERFESKYIPEPNSGCWLWEGSVNSDGYGRFRYNKKLMGAHRFSIMLYKEQEDKDMCVCHSCDNPCCLNPTHLFFGTHLENMRDRTKKGRGILPNKKGVDHYKSKFTEKDVVEIKKMISDGVINSVIAKKYGVTTGSIRHIQIGRRWKHI